MAKKWRAPKHLARAWAAIGITATRAEDAMNCEGEKSGCNFFVNIPRAAQCCADGAAVRAVLALDKAGLLA